MTTAVTLKSAARSTRGEPPDGVQVRGRLEVGDRVDAAGPGRCAGRPASPPRARRSASARRAAGSPAGRRRPSRPWAGWSAGGPRRPGRGSRGPGRPAASPSRSCSALKVRRSCRVTGHVRAALDPHPALVAGAVAAAGGVDGDAVPRGGVEDGDAGRHPDARAGSWVRRRRPSAVACTVKVRSTRPVPSCAPGSEPPGAIRPSRATSSREKSGESVTASRRLPGPGGRGGRRSRRRPTRRGPAAGRRPSRPRRSAGCGCP